MEGQCPTCGRQPQDWTDRSPGAKKQQVLDGHKRAEPYKAFRRKLGRELLVNDIDQVEWRIGEGGVVVPVATIEISAIKGTMTVPPSYMENNLIRLFKRDGQGRFSQEMARRLGVNSYFTLFYSDLMDSPRARFLTVCLSDPGPGWRLTTMEEYVFWLQSLPTRPPLDPYVPDRFLEEVNTTAPVKAGEELTEGQVNWG